METSTRVPSPGAERTVEDATQVGDQAGERTQTDVPVGGSFVERLGREATAVVVDTQLHRALLVRIGDDPEVDAHLCGPGVADHVAQRLLGGPVDETGGLGIDDGLAEIGLEAGLETPRRESAEQVADGRLQPFLLQVRWIDLDQQRPQRLDARADGRRGVEHLLTADRLAPPLGGERERHAGELLDDAVVQIARDPAAFGIGGVEGVPEQPFAFALARLETACHRPRERDLHELEHDERADRDGCELGPQVAPDLGHAAVAEVRLEQQRRARRCLGAQVDLEQLRIGLEPVLRLGEVADLGALFVAREDRPLVVAELELLADQPGFVGVEDRAVLGPDLDPDERAAQHGRPDRGVDPVERVAVHGEHVVAEQRRDDAGRAHERHPLGLVDRLLGADPPAGVGRERSRRTPTRRARRSRTGRRASRPRSA